MLQESTRDIFRLCGYNPNPLPVGVVGRMVVQCDRNEKVSRKTYESYERGEGEQGREDSW